MPFMPRAYSIVSVALLIYVGHGAQASPAGGDRVHDEGAASLIRQSAVDSSGRVSGAESNFDEAQRLRAKENAEEYHLSHVQTHVQTEAADQWDATSMIHVWCGGHAASECTACTQDLGHEWCNGDCEWSLGECLFRRDRVWCGNRAVDDCSQCMDHQSTAPGGTWCDGQCAWRGTAEAKGGDGMACVRKNGEDEMVPEESKMAQKSDDSEDVQKQVEKPSVPPTEIGISKGLPPGYNAPGQHSGGVPWMQAASGGQANGGAGSTTGSTTAAPGGRYGANAPWRQPAKPSVVLKAAPDAGDGYPMLSGDDAHQKVAAKIAGGDDAGSASAASNAGGVNAKKPCPKNETAALVRKIVGSSNAAPAVDPLAAPN